MNLDEALAVYLFLKDVPPGKRDQKLFLRAWGVICSYAVKVVDREK